MNRSQVVPAHSKQILNDAVHVEETLSVYRTRFPGHTFVLCRLA